MAFSKANKAIFRAKYGDKVYEAILAAENIFVTESDSSEKSLAEKLAELVQSIGTKASSDDLSAVSGKVSTLIGSDTGKSARVIAGEVLAAAGKLERKKVSSVNDIDPTAEDADKYIYMVPKGTAKSGDKYDEYMVIDGAVEKVGDWEVDLADYIQKVTGATEDDVAVFDANGKIKDGGKKLSDFVEKETGKGLSTNDYSDEEKQKVAGSKTVTDKLSGNADVLKDISSTDITNWNGAGHVYASATQPENLKNGDLWLQTFAE